MAEYKIVRNLYIIIFQMTCFSTIATVHQVASWSLHPVHKEVSYLQDQVVHYPQYPPLVSHKEWVTLWEMLNTK